MIIVGSPDSANSTRLWKISKKINKKSYFIENIKQFDRKWLKNCTKIGISAGASAPKWIIKEIIEYLKK